MDLVFKVEKEKTKKEVVNEINAQLKLDKDPKLSTKINSYRIEPALRLAIWDYSENPTSYPVWLIIKSESDDTGILFSEYGFGNWGLVKLSDEPLHFGTDSHWFNTLEETFLNSWMAE